MDQASPKLKMVEIGKSPMVKPMHIVFVSSEENILNLDNLKRINRQLALDPDLSELEREMIFRDGKGFCLATLSMHSGEVAFSQSAPLIVYDLVTTSDPEKLEWLGNVFYMMVPCHNPDGMDIIVEYYRKNVETKYEGSFHGYWKGKKGFTKLMAFVDQGWTILSWGESTASFIGPLSMKKGDTTEDFQLQVNDFSKSIQKAGVACPGSLVKMKLVTDHPLTL